DAADDGNESWDAGVAAPSTTGFAVPSQRLSLPADAAVQIGDVRTWTGGAASAIWQRRWSADLATTATVARSRFDGSRDQSFFLPSAQTGADYSSVAGRAGSGALTERNTIEDTTIRIGASIAAGFAHAIEAGVDHVAVDAIYDGRQESASGLVPLLARNST